LTALLRKIHIYAGLLTFVQLIVYGIAGLAAAYYGGIIRPQTPESVRYVPFTVPASATDKQVARLVYETLNPAMARPVPDWFLQRTADNHLRLDFYNINGIHRVVVLEKEGRLRVEEIRNNMALFLEDIHAATPGDEESPTLMKFWEWWNEGAMWTLLGFCLTGVWLWLAARPRNVAAWALLTLGTGALAALWSVFR
jgi:hypothetical protein